MITIDTSTQDKINLMAVYLREMLEKKAEQPTKMFKLELTYNNKALLFQVEFSKVIDFENPSLYFFEKAAAMVGISIFPRYPANSHTKWSWGLEEALFFDNMTK